MPSNLVAIPGRPGFGALLWWFQGPAEEAAEYQFELDGHSLSPAHVRLIRLADGLPGFQGEAAELARRTFLLVTSHSDGFSGKCHTLRVQCAGDFSNPAHSRTLPAKPSPLKLVLASCYYAGNSRLPVQRPLPSELLGLDALPHVKVLCGDQIYLDLSMAGLWPSELDSTWRRYADQWADAAFVAWMAAGGNLCLPDDHEFWNNFPSEKRLGRLSVLWDKPTQAVREEMEQAYVIYQAVLNADPDRLWDEPQLKVDDLLFFEFPGPSAPASFNDCVRFVLLDTRFKRIAPESPQASPRFTEQAWLDETTTLLDTCQAPVVLVTAQSLLDGPGGVESNLADFDRQHAQLWNAFSRRKNGVLLLTGDIHWSRAQEFRFDPRSGCTHYEVVSSALSRISLMSEKLPGVSSVVHWEQMAHSLTATRTADTHATSNFAILRFDLGSRGLRCNVRWWEIDGDGQFRQLPLNPGWLGDAGRAVGLQKAQMDVNFELD